MWHLKVQGDALLAWGFLFSAFPSVDTSTRSFTFARRKEVKVAPLFSDFKLAFPPRDCGASGGLLWWCFSFMSLKWVSLVFKHLPPAFPYCTAIYFSWQAVNQQLNPNPFPVPPPHCLGLSPAVLLLKTGPGGASTTASDLAGGGRLPAAVPRALFTPESCRHHGKKPGPFVPLFCPWSTGRLLAFPLAVPVSGDPTWTPVTQGTPALRPNAVRNSRGK